MRRLVPFALMLALLLPLQPAHAQAPAAAATAPDAAWQAWVERFAATVGRETQRMGQVMAALQPIQADLGSRAKMQAHLPKVQALVAGIKADLARSTTELAALRASAPPSPPGLPLSAEQIIADAQRQNKAAVQMMAAAQQLFAAAAAGDVATVNRIAPTLATSGVLLVDNQAAIYRTRRDVMAGNTTVRAAMGLMATLYDAMADTMRIAVYGAPPFQADLAIPRRNLVTLAANARNWAATGEAEVARQLATLDAASQSRPTAAEVTKIAEFRQAYAAYAQLFMVGRDLSAEITAIHGKLGKGAADAASARQSLPRLITMEQQALGAMQSVNAR